MKKQVFSLGASLAVLATMALSGFGAAAEGTTVFSDDFERDTLGDTYTSTADEAAVGVKDGQLVFKNNVDGTGVFVKLPEALGDSYALSFDFKQGETSTALAVMVGLTDADELLYPLCGVMERLAYDATYDGKGGWQLVQRETGAQLAVMTGESEGLCENALAIVDGVILLSDENQRVYAYAGEAYLNAAMLEKLGVSVTPLGDVATIETR